MITHISLLRFEAAEVAIPLLLGSSNSGGTAPGANLRRFMYDVCAASPPCRREAAHKDCRYPLQDSA